MAELPDLSLTDTYLDALRRDSWMQAVQSQFTDQELLDITFEEIISTAAPLMIRASARFFRETYDITLEADVSSYPIPSGAMGNVLHLAELLDSTGQPSKLTRREPAEEIYFAVSASGHPLSVRLDDKRIVIAPAPSSGDVAAWPTLRTYIHRTPARLVRATASEDYEGRAVRVASAPVAGVVTYTGPLPSDFSSSSEHDFYSFESPFERLVEATAATAIDVSAGTQTFDATAAAELSAGDYVCLKNETVFLPVPANMVKHVKSLTIGHIAASRGDKDLIAAAEKAFTTDLQVLYPSVADPLKENPQPVSLFPSPFMQLLGRRGRPMTRW